MVEWFTVHLPRPPSVNSFMRKLGNESPNVRKWRKAADSYLMAIRYPRIRGEYELMLKFPVAERGKYDLDNFCKPASDYLQRVEIIENDKLAQRIVLCWGEVPRGFCRVSVRPWISE